MPCWMRGGLCGAVTADEAYGDKGPPSAVPLVSDLRFCRSGQRLARLTLSADGQRFESAHRLQVSTAKIRFYLRSLLDLARDAGPP